MFRKIYNDSKHNYIFNNYIKTDFKKADNINKIEKIYQEELDKKFIKMLKNVYNDYFFKFLDLEKKYSEKLQYLYFLTIAFKIYLIKEIENKNLTKKEIKDYKNLEIIKKYKIQITFVEKTKNFYDNFFIYSYIQESDKQLYDFLENYLKKIDIDFNIVKKRSKQVNKWLSIQFYNIIDGINLYWYHYKWLKKITKLYTNNKYLKKDLKILKKILKWYEKYFYISLEVLILFYIKRYKKYLLQPDKFLGAVGYVLEKITEDLDIGKRNVFSWNLKVWLATWVPKYTKDYIVNYVRSLEKAEKEAKNYKKTEIFYNDTDNKFLENTQEQEDQNQQNINIKEIFNSLSYKIDYNKLITYKMLIEELLKNQNQNIYVDFDINFDIINNFLEELSNIFVDDDDFLRKVLLLQKKIKEEPKIWNLLIFKIKERYEKGYI